jgi:hypothetical protein
VANSVGEMGNCIGGDGLKLMGFIVEFSYSGGNSWR